MFSKTLCIFVIVNFVSGSYAQKDKRFFRKDYTYVEAAEGFFKINPIPNTWTAGKRVCALEGAIFWHPKDENEMQAVIQFWNNTNPDAEYLWTGLSDILVEGRFETVDGRPSSEVYVNWSVNRDSNQDFDCVYIDKNGKMRYYACNTNDFFICKKSLHSLEWNHHCNIPNLDYTYNKNTGKCYKLHTTPLNWTDASDMCQLEQATLAVIGNKLEADYLANLTQSSPNPRVKESYQRGIYHLGFHNRLNEGWQTVRGKPLKEDDVEVWLDNYQPDGDEECGSMFFNGRLVNTDCEIKCFFICEHVVDNVHLISTV